MKRPVVVVERPVLLRRTKNFHYYRMPDQTILSVPNTEAVTEYENVMPKPKEYAGKKTTNRVTRKSTTAPKRGKSTVSRASNKTQTRILRQTINRNAAKASLVYETIDLNITVVPKPKKIKNKNQLRKRQIVHGQFSHCYLTFAFSFFHCRWDRSHLLQW